MRSVLKAYPIIVTVALVIFLIGVIQLVRLDAIARARAENAEGAARVQIEALRGAQEKRDAIEALDDDGLLDRLGRWILPAPPGS